MVSVDSGFSEVSETLVPIAHSTMVGDNPIIHPKPMSIGKTLQLKLEDVILEKLATIELLEILQKETLVFKTRKINAWYKLV